MGLFDKLLGKKGKKDVEISPILPSEIYEAGVLELRDVIAPAAIKIAPKQIYLGEKNLAGLFCNFISTVYFR